MINYKQYTPVLLVIILAVYIMNVGNHYRLFLDEDKKLRNEIEDIRHDLFTTTRFIEKVFEHTNLTGNNIPVFNKYLKGSSCKIAAIFNAEAAVSINTNLLRLVRTIKNENDKIFIATFSTEPAESSNHIYIMLNELALSEQPELFVLGHQNQILYAISLDGTEKEEELRLISRYIMSFIKTNYKIL